MDVWTSNSKQIWTIIWLRSGHKIQNGIFGHGPIWDLGQFGPGPIQCHGARDPDVDFNETC